MFMSCAACSLQQGCMGAGPTSQHTAVARGLGNGCPSSQSSGAAPAMLLGQAWAALSRASASLTSA